MTTSAAPTDLTTMLSQTLGGATVTELRRLSGGASRETWRFEADGRPLILQRQRAGDVRDMMVEAGVVRTARLHGVPVPELIDARRRDDGMAFMILEAIDGETIARKIQRDDAFAGCRVRLVADFADALARLHSIDPGDVSGLMHTDQIEFYTEVIDELGEPHPVLELVRNWLLDHRPDSPRTVVVHGDFRLGNLIVGEDGLRAVIDWELAHLGDPMEDLGWLCVKAWRFGGREPVAGLGAYEQLFAAYEEAGGGAVDVEVVRWWEVLGTWKWAVMCILQANVHRSGVTRSHELAAIGRRVCENEHDLLVALEGRW
jgi:aminoglycoside phosphotransferase (APT) family kinase protein